jgi:MtN3 and saliva related transmembrane protein
MTVLVGLLAGALTTGAWLPQIVQTWRTRSAEDLSWGYLATMGIGFVTWLTYGLLSRDPAVVATNIATLLLLGVLIALKGRAAAPLQVVEPVLEPAA